MEGPWPSEPASKPPTQLYLHGHRRPRLWRAWVIKRNQSGLTDVTTEVSGGPLSMDIGSFMGCHQRPTGEAPWVPMPQASCSFSNVCLPKSPDTSSLQTKMAQEGPGVGLLSPYRFHPPGPCSEQGAPTSQETVSLLHKPPLRV